LPGFEATAWFALVAPAGTDAALVEKASDDVNAVFQDPSLVKRLEESGTFTRRMDASQLRAFIDVQKRRWSPVVQRFGL
jgi:tripartite-type tricarboxylate transporter receptor subunit TctC